MWSHVLSRHYPRELLRPHSPVGSTGPGVNSVMVLTPRSSVTPSSLAESTSSRTQRGQVGRHLPRPVVPPSGSPTSTQICITSSRSATGNRSRNSAKSSLMSAPVFQRDVFSVTPSAPVSAVDPVATPLPDSVVAPDAIAKSSGKRKSARRPAYTPAKHPKKINPAGSHSTSPRATPSNRSTRPSSVSSFGASEAYVSTAALPALTSVASDLPLSLSVPIFGIPNPSCEGCV